jgi:1-acyl-sn-glycerol-3-phosphate acyltransferase
MVALLRHAFFLLVVRPLVLVVLGLNVRHGERLPRTGPALVVANHNSHLDTLVLMTLFPRRLLGRLRPVAAADYFFRGRARSWFSREILGAIPIERRGARRNHDPLAPVSAALAERSIVILFPEGTRGEPERLARFRSGVYRLARRHPEVPVVPVFLHGLGKALPRGEAVLVPFFCDVFVGAPLAPEPEKEAFMDRLTQRMQELAAEGAFPAWE